ncbi:hypothetical protein DESC_740146 [Desulfosarcina cetonica]|nr:hypothetical protein DESC_740146 [Desulfosarcina cetonica]
MEIPECVEVGRQVAGVDAAMDPYQNDRQGYDEIRQNDVLRFLEQVGAIFKCRREIVKQKPGNEDKQYGTIAEKRASDHPEQGVGQSRFKNRRGHPDVRGDDKKNRQGSKIVNVN